MDLREKIIKNEQTCKGVFWRGSVSSYLSSYNSIEVRKSLRLLKKMSCKGCPTCDFLWEFLQEDITMEKIDYLGDIEDGRIYTYQINSSKGYYDLYPEVDGIEFIKVENEHKGRTDIK